MDDTVEAAYRSWPAMAGAYAKWRLDGRREVEEDKTEQFLVQYGRGLHKMHLEEFRVAFTANGAPQRVMMLRQMNAELEAELRKRDAREEQLAWREALIWESEANIWAHALPGGPLPGRAASD